MSLTNRPDAIGGVAGKGELQARFQAYVKQTRIVTAGEVSITLSVPYEQKYLAFPITDLRAMLWTVEVYAPPGITPDDLERYIEQNIEDGGKGGKPPRTLGQVLDGVDGGPFDWTEDYD